MKISLVICTFNRSESLKRTLRSLTQAFIPEGLSWELILVDNNSKDNTKTIIEEFRKGCGLNIRCVLEQKQGISHARNRGIREAMGEIIAFTDDDVIIDKHMLFNTAEAFKGPDVSCMGGKILPIWEVPKPKWLKRDLYGYLALLDYGDTPFYMNSPNIWGANFAVKADLFKKYGGFDTNRGRIPGKLYAGEETYFLEKLLKGGDKILYYPKAVIYHCIPKDRISKKYFRKWNFDQGELHARLLGDYWKRNLYRVPYYIIKQLLIKMPFYFLRLVLFSKDSLKHELEIIYLWSFILGRIRFKH